MRVAARRHATAERRRLIGPSPYAHASGTLYQTTSPVVIAGTEIRCVTYPRTTSDGLERTHNGPC